RGTLTAAFPRRVFGNADRCATRVSLISERANRVLLANSCSGDHRASRVTTDLLKGLTSRRRDYQTRLATNRKPCLSHLARRTPRRLDTQTLLGSWRSGRPKPRLLPHDLPRHIARWRGRNAENLRWVRVELHARPPRRHRVGQQ